jgi:hypothetical protein
MLFTDSDLITGASLLALDPEVQAVNAMCQKDQTAPIVLDGPGSICEEAWIECRNKLEPQLAAFSTMFGQAGQQPHLAAVFNTGGSYSSGTRARLRLNQIVAHDIYYSASASQLQKWMRFEALQILFRAAANRLRSNKGDEDRYEKKRRQYASDAQTAWERMRTSGMPYVITYLDAPGAKHAFRAGSWGTANLSQTAGGSGSAGTVYVAITYCSTSGGYVSPISKGNAESGPSAEVSVALSAANLLSVSIASLNPPDGANPPNVGLSQGVTPFLTATHWNVYVGSVAGGDKYLQNGSPIPIATKSYMLADAPVFSGYTLEPGQFADPSANALFGNVITRG